MRCDCRKQKGNPMIKLAIYDKEIKGYYHRRGWSRDIHQAQLWGTDNQQRGQIKSKITNEIVSSWRTNKLSKEQVAARLVVVEVEIAMHHGKEEKMRDFDPRYWAHTTARDLVKEL